MENTPSGGGSSTRAIDTLSTQRVKRPRKVNNKLGKIVELNKCLTKEFLLALEDELTTGGKKGNDK